MIESYVYPFLFVVVLTVLYTDREKKEMVYHEAALAAFYRMIPSHEKDVVVHDELCVGQEIFL